MVVANQFIFLGDLVLEVAPIRVLHHDAQGLVVRVVETALVLDDIGDQD